MLVEKLAPLLARTISSDASGSTVCMSAYSQKSGAGRAGPGLENLSLPSGRAGPGLELTGPGRAGPNNISAAFGPGRAGLKVHGPGPGRALTFRPVEHSSGECITSGVQGTGTIRY